MSLQSVVLSLISDIPDPGIRHDVASTVYFLRDVYINGKISLEDLKRELTDIVNTVLDVTHPELLPEEKKKKVDMLVDQLLRAIKMDTLRIRMLRKFSQSPATSSAPF